MFEMERFIEDCKEAVHQDPTHISVAEIMKRAMSDHASIRNALGAPEKALIDPLYRSDSLTILHLIWKPGVTIMPHNHNMWAVIGLYSGREDNIFWRRTKGADGGKIEAAGAEALSTGDVAPLGKDIIHSVTNPTGKFTGAIHIYGGDFFDAHRSEWDPEELTEQPYDIEKAKALFN